MAITKTQNPLATSAIATLTKPKATAPVPQPNQTPTQPTDRVTLSPQARNNAAQRPTKAAPQTQATTTQGQTQATQRLESRKQAPPPTTTAQTPNKTPPNPVNKMV